MIPAIVEALLAALNDEQQNDRHLFSKEQRRRLKCRTRGERRIIRLRASVTVNQAALKSVMGGRQRR